MAYKIYLKHGITWSNNKRGNRAHSSTDGTFVSAHTTSYNTDSDTLNPKKYGYKYEKASNLSDDELKRRNQRKQNEKKYEELYNPGKAISGLGGHISNLGRSLGNVRLKGEKGPKADLSGYSDQELQRIINRARNEAEYDRLFNPERVSAGQKFIDGLNTALPIIGGTVALAGGIYGLYKKIKG